MSFPRDFVWGAATSSYQIEGGGLEDGRGECIWHRFSHTPGNVSNNDHGDIACDHIHRYRDDVALMAQLGLHAYRFSIAWPRVLPQGTGASNPAGLDFYDRLVDALLEHHITPFVTLYHWDLPQALQVRGGWENPDSVEWFRDYAALTADRLGDRVSSWTTHNEPQVAAFAGNLHGIHAPGKQDPKAAYTVAHHLLLSHGAAVPVIRERVPGAQVGITLDLPYIMPASAADADVQAARTVDGGGNCWFLEPVFNGAYPADIVAQVGDAVADLDLAAVRAAAVPIDFLGINYYTRHVITADASVPSGIRTVTIDDASHTEMGWEVYPDGLRAQLVRVWQDYAPQAIYVTENGAANLDRPANGTDVVEDPERVQYYQAHLDACATAIAAGVPLKGYFAWSLFDNFEWGHGYSKRFGLVYVDFETQQRTLKRSALAYRDIISRHAAAHGL